MSAAARMMTNGPLKLVNKPKDLRICAAYGMLKGALPNAASSSGFAVGHASTDGFSNHELSNATHGHDLMSPEPFNSTEVADRGHAANGAVGAVRRSGSSEKGGCILPPIDNHRIDHESPAASEKTSEAASHSQSPPRAGPWPHRGASIDPVAQWSREAAPVRKKHRSHRSVNNRAADDDAAAELSRRRSLDMRRQRLVEDPEYMDGEIRNLRRGKFQTQSMMRQTTRDELYENACLYTPYATGIRQRRRKFMEQIGGSHSAKDLGDGEPYRVNWGPAERGSYAMNRSRSTPTFDSRPLNKRGSEASSSTYEVRSLRQQIEGSHRKLQELDGRKDEPVENSAVQDVQAAMRSLFQKKVVSYADVTHSDS